jgi:hypothetical protein
MKKSLCLVLLALFASLPVLSAQEDAGSTPQPAPAYCNPCLFYGGDLGSNGNGTANEDTLLVPYTAVLVPFDVPSGQTWKLTALFTNNLAGVNLIDPKQAKWSVSKNVKANDCGTVLASGDSPASFVATGRQSFGASEYTVGVRIPPLKLASGRYWLSVVPECTNANNGECSVAQYFVSEFDGTGVNAYGPPEPENLSFATSTFFGLNCSPVPGKYSAGATGASSTPVRTPQ